MRKPTFNTISHSTIEAWIDNAQASEEFQEGLDVQSRFHDYSHRNTRLIKLQCPEATEVAGYNTWRNDFDRREVEAETVAYIVGRYFGLDTSGSAFYLAAWQDDEPEVIQDRFGRISSTAEEIIEVIDG